MTSEQEEGRVADPALQETASAPTRIRGDSNPADGHEGYMRGLASRIRWLERHRHWWLRTEDGRAQREFLDRRDAA